MGQCKIRGCTRSAGEKRRICHHHRTQAYKAKHPERYAFGVLRRNAKRRGVVFGLTFEDFKKFCQKTGYMNGKGKSSEGFHIDRIDETKGYFKGNIQVLTNSENVKKYIAYEHDEKKIRYRKKLELKEEDYPF